MLRISDPADMKPAERRAEIAAILARGVVRLKAKGLRPQENSANSLNGADEEVPFPTVRKRRRRQGEDPAADAWGRTVVHVVHFRRGARGRKKIIHGKKPPAGKAKSGSVSIRDFDRDQLKEALLEVVGTDWTERDDAIRAAAYHLGFKRVGKNIRKAFASAITGLLRQHRLESAGSLVRRSQ